MSFVLGAVFVLTLHAFFCVERPTALLRESTNVHSKEYGNMWPPPTIYGQVSSNSRFMVEPSVQKVYDDMENQDNTERCSRYGWEYKPRDKPRRIFFGSLIADDSLDTVMIHATETYGIYDTVVFVESTLTQTATVRALHYGEGSERLQILQSGIFGPSTHVYVDYFFNETITVGKATRARL